MAAVEGQLAANRAGARKLSAAERAQRRQRQVRKYIEEQVYRRLMAVVVNRQRVRRNIIVASNPADYIWEGGPNGEHAGYQGKMFSKGSAAALAKHYDDFQFTGRNRVNRRGDTRQLIGDARVEETIRGICDPAQYGVPPDDEPEEPMTPEEAATLERALASARNFLLGTGIEIQIAQPGHRPKYNFIPGQYGSRQGAGWPIDDVRRFVVMFTGLDFQKRFGDDALRYLDATGLRRVVEPAFRAASEAYGGDLQLAVVTDNGVERG